MSLLFVESFDADGSLGGGPQQAVAKWTTCNGQFVAGRNGQGFNNKDLMVALPAGDHFTVGFATQGSPGGSPLNWQGNMFALGAPLGTGALAVDIFEANVAADGTIVLLAGNVVIGNPTSYTFSAGVWAAIGMDIVLSNSGGNIVVAVELFVNSVSIFSGSATSNVSVAGLLSQQAKANMFKFGNFGTSPGNTIDDLFILDNVVKSGLQPNAQYTDVGDVGIFTIYPRQDVQNDWTPLSGTDRFAMVNEHPPDGDTSYIFDDTVGHTQTFFFDTVASFTGQIKGVQLSIYARKDDEGEREIVDAAGSGSFVGATPVSLGDSYRYFMFPYDIDPISGNAWTPAIINAGDYGVQLAA